MACFLEMVVLQPEDKPLVIAVFIAYFVMTGFKIVDLELDIFDERTKVIEAQMLEATFWIRIFQRVCKLMNAEEKEKFDSANVELVEAED